MAADITLRQLRMLLTEEIGEWMVFAEQLEYHNIIIDYNNIIRTWINCYFFNPALGLLVTVQTFATNKNNQES